MEGTESRARRSVIEQFTRSAVPRHEPETEEADAYKEARARSRESLMLDVILPDGRIESFPYSRLSRVTFLPKGQLILRFGKSEVSAVGNNLHRVRQAVTEGRARFIQQGIEADTDTKPQDAAHIEEITITEREDEA